MEYVLPLVQVLSNLAALIRFVDWTKAKTETKRKKKKQGPLEKLRIIDADLDKIKTALKEKKDISRIIEYVDELSEAKAQLTKELRSLGIETPKEVKPPKMRNASSEATLTMIDLCKRSVALAEKKLAE